MGGNVFCFFLYLGNKQHTHTQKKDANQIAGDYFFVFLSPLFLSFDCKYTEQLYDIREEKNSTV